MRVKKRVTLLKIERQKSILSIYLSFWWLVESKVRTLPSGDLAPNYYMNILPIKIYIYKYSFFSWTSPNRLASKMPHENIFTTWKKKPHNLHNFSTFSVSITLLKLFFHWFIPIQWRQIQNDHGIIFHGVLGFEVTKTSTMVSVTNYYPTFVVQQWVICTIPVLIPDSTLQW